MNTRDSGRDDMTIRQLTFEEWLSKHPELDDSKECKWCGGSYSSEPCDKCDGECCGETGGICEHCLIETRMLYGKILNTEKEKLLQLQNIA